MNKRKIKISLLDKTIALISPKAAQERIMNKVAFNNSMGVLSDQGFITNTSNRRSMRGWSATANNSNADIIPKSESMRASSRDLNMNSPIAHAAIERFSTNSLGLGLKCKPQIEREFLGFNGSEGNEAAKKWEINTQREWEAFSESIYSDAELTYNINENAVLVFTNMLLSGDVFVALPAIKIHGQTYNTKIKVIEADYCTNPMGLMETYKIAGGVEVNRLGAPIAYHLIKQNATDILSINGLHRQKWERIERFNKMGLQQILHLFRKTRPGQRKGVGILAPIIETIKQRTRYEKAEIDAAILNAMFTVFIKSVNNSTGKQLETGYVPPSLDSGIDESVNVSEKIVTKAQDSDDKNYQIGNANILELDENQDISMADPKHPIIGYEKFADATAKEIGAALGISHEVLMMEFGKSFSASKAALQEAWKSFMLYRKFMINHYFEPIYETFMYEAIAKGRIEAPGFIDDAIIRKAWLRADWVGAGQGMIDPLKETNAAVKRIENRITTREREYQQIVGGDWYVGMNNFSKEIDHLESLDISTNSDKLTKHTLEQKNLQKDNNNV